MDMESSFSMSNICNGDGCCLTQTNDCNTYEKYPNVTCGYNCKAIPCPNVEICGQWGPKWYLRLRNSKVCLHCDMYFTKKLDFVEDMECPMCFETTRCVVQPNCTHVTCVDCFKRCWNGEMDTPPPKFPYPEEIEKQYYKELDESPDIYAYTDIDDKWHQYYPLLVEYDRQYELYNHYKDSKYISEGNLRKCPLCRQ